MSLRIEMAVNGWAVFVSGYGAEPGETWVFSEEGDGEVEAFADMLRAVNDIIGPPTSRHDAKRVYVEVRPGDKYEKAEDDE